MSILGFYWRLRRRVQDDGARIADVESVAEQVLARPLLEVEPTRECAICLQSDGLEAPGAETGLEADALISRGRWRGLPCFHAFHEDCLLRWLTRSRHCPLCRFDLLDAYGLALPAAEEAEAL